LPSPALGSLSRHKKEEAAGAAGAAGAAAAAAMNHPQHVIVGSPTRVMDLGFQPLLDLRLLLVGEEDDDKEDDDFDATEAESEASDNAPLG